MAFISIQTVKCSAICLKNGKVEYAGLRRKAGSTVTLKCDPGYSLTGSNSATCEAGGTWTSSITKSRCTRSKSLIVCIYRCVYVHTCTYMSIYVCIYMFMDVRVRMYVYTCVFYSIFLSTDYVCFMDFDI